MLKISALFSCVYSCLRPNTRVNEVIHNANFFRARQALVVAILILCLSTLLFTAPAAAHSIVYRVIAGEGLAVQFGSQATDAAGNQSAVENTGLAVQFNYSGSFKGVPAYADYRVYGPGDVDEPFQEGQADRLGRVAFLPDEAGLWRIELRSEEGHEAQARIEVSEELAVPASPRWERWLLLVSLIANASLLVYVKQLRRKRREEVAAG